MLELEERPVLMGEGAAVAFYRECASPVMSCPQLDQATWVKAFSSLDGTFLCKAKVLPEGVVGRVEEAALTGVNAGAVTTLVQVSLDGGAHGKGIGTADYLIAGMCLAHGATLLTRNLKHFERVPGLRIVGQFS